MFYAYSTVFRTDLSFQQKDECHFRHSRLKYHGIRIWGGNQYCPHQLNYVLGMVPYMLKSNAISLPGPIRFNRYDNRN
jgi:hypothetical protein